MMTTMLWNTLAANPVVAPGLDHGGLVTTHAGAAHVVRVGEQLHMYYWAADARKQYHIVRAVAAADDPTVWKADGGPLLSPQPDSATNCKGPSFPHVHAVDERRVLLYFVGWGARRDDGKLPNTTGVAVSEDGGRTFRYHDANPILPLDTDNDREGTGSLWIERAGGTYRMWYTAIGRYFPRPEGVATGHGAVIPSIGIGYAESSDGLRWRKPLARRVVEPRGFGVEPYEYICSKPVILRDEAGYTLWVNTFGTAYRVHQLRSVDGLTWRWEPRVGPDGELPPGPAGSFDDLQRSYPTMLRANGRLHCWYTGNHFGRTGIGYAWREAP